MSKYIYIYIFKKRTRVGHAFFTKERKVLRSFAFFCILCILLRSLQKNVAFFALFYVLCKRTLRALHYFMFFRKNAKERIVLLGLISRQNAKTRKKNAKKRYVL